MKAECRSQPMQEQAAAVPCPCSPQLCAGCVPLCRVERRRASPLLTAGWCLLESTRNVVLVKRLVVELSQPCPEFLGLPQEGVTSWESKPCPAPAAGAALCLSQAGVVQDPC